MAAASRNAAQPVVASPLPDQGKARRSRPPGTWASRRTRAGSHRSHRGSSASVRAGARQEPGNRPPAPSPLGAQADGNLGLRRRPYRRSGPPARSAGSADPPYRLQALDCPATRSPAGRGRPAAGRSQNGRDAGQAQRARRQAASARRAAATGDFGADAVRRIRMTVQTCCRWQLRGGKGQVRHGANQPTADDADGGAAPGAYKSPHGGALSVDADDASTKASAVQQVTTVAKRAAGMGRSFENTRWRPRGRRRWRAKVL